MAVCTRTLGTNGAWTVSSTRLDPPRPASTCLDPLRTKARGQGPRDAMPEGLAEQRGKGEGGNMWR